MGSTDFQGRIKRIQWNNQVISGLMMVYFVVSILVFVSLIFLVFLSVTYIFDPNSVSSIAHSPVVQRKFARIFGKIVFLVLQALIILFTVTLRTQAHVSEEQR
ncbi:MAG: hypothetical protein KDI90_03140 [Alphaproteobacteria bacterium]|nr:hypothetical protein [Alphaproteobacteria bacterium]MCB9975964.1 hypothetical protein [Rhodospirillales bacterium]